MQYLTDQATRHTSHSHSHHPVTTQTTRWELSQLETKCSQVSKVIGPVIADVLELEWRGLPKMVRFYVRFVISPFMSRLRSLSGVLSKISLKIFSFYACCSALLVLLWFSFYHHLRGGSYNYPLLTGQNIRWIIIIFMRSCSHNDILPETLSPCVTHRWWEDERHCYGIQCHSRI